MFFKVIVKKKSGDKIEEGGDKIAISGDKVEKSSDKVTISGDKKASIDLICTIYGCSKRKEYLSEILFPFLVNVI